MTDTMPDKLTITGTVIDASGLPGTFDHKGDDYDILREAVIAAGLADVLDDPHQDLTVFAPRDSAFIDLAKGLGFEGTDEPGALNYIVEALTLLGGGNPIPLLQDILLYHVVQGGLTVSEVLDVAGDGSPITTLLGETLNLNLETDPPSLADKDTGIDDPGLVKFDTIASNGVIHDLNGVLLPVSVSSIITQKNTDFIIGDDSGEFLFTGRGQDFVQGAGGRDVINVGRGNDVALGGDGNDVIFGGRGHDTLEGDDGNDRMFGGRGKDTLRGDDGNDKIFGGRGKDLIDGGADNDKLFGGRGQDTFFFEDGDGRDRIVDFRIGKDTIDLSGYDGIENFGDLEDHISGSRFRAKIDLDDGDSITLLGVNANNLSESDFIFA